MGDDAGAAGADVDGAGAAGADVDGAGAAGADVDGAGDDGPDAGDAGASDAEGAVEDCVTSGVELADSVPTEQPVAARTSPQPMAKVLSDFFMMFPFEMCPT
ncbi:hypothetical protein [Arthrobacter castelli]|uniref:hypothetical protein n=1 Tax=Arthrobacter castelli TaxID=271431 RepID=UPI000403CA8E|nr:hypothetical protein [Arthrobacter castelli]